jgi:pilus assembly protein Flp/PilA
MHAFSAALTSLFYTAKTRHNSNERGATMVEYGIMVAFIAVVVMAVVILLGPKVTDLFTQVSAEL